MSVWLTPDLKPVYGGTYYPPDDRYFGQPGFSTILKSLAEQVVKLFFMSEFTVHLIQPLLTVERVLSKVQNIRGSNSGSLDAIGIYRRSWGRAECFRLRYGMFQSAKTLLRAPVRRVQPSSQVPATREPKFPPPALRTDGL